MTLCLHQLSRRFATLGTIDRVARAKLTLTTKVLVSNPVRRFTGYPTGGSPVMAEYQSILYRVEERVAHITLNRPHRYNAIDLYIPFELERAVEAANLDDNVKVCDVDYNCSLSVV